VISSFFLPITVTDISGRHMPSAPVKTGHLDKKGRLYTMKKCPSCGQIFSLDELLSDPSIIPVGMTSDEEVELESLYYFTHDVPECGTTFTVQVTLFESVIEEPIPVESMRHGHACMGLCTHIEELALCQNNCKWAPYRRLLLLMVERRKAAAKQA
jgi:hypothetical protein